MAKKGYKMSQEHKDKIRESCRNCPVIHHINGNHFDDRPENRMVVTPSEHAKIHMLQGDIHTFKEGEYLGHGFKKGHNLWNLRKGGKHAKHNTKKKENRKEQEDNF